MVTQLACDQRHYFHTDCLESSIRQGNVQCPLCREPILQEIGFLAPRPRVRWGGDQERAALLRGYEEGMQAGSDGAALNLE